MVPEKKRETKQIAKLDKKVTFAPLKSDSNSLEETAFYLLADDKL